MAEFGNLIYTPERATGEAIGKVESHTPKVEVPEKIKANEPFEVKITVGPHPNRVEHSIRTIWVYFYEDGRPFNPIHVMTINLEPVYSEPDVTIKVKVPKSGTLYVLEYCNLHGVWEARAKINVEE